MREGQEGDGGEGMEKGKRRGNAEGEEEMGEEGWQGGTSRHFFFSTLRTAGYSSCCELGHIYAHSSLCYLGK